MNVLALRLAGGTDATNAASEDDSALLRAAARQDRAAFERIVSRHYQVVYRVVWRLTAGHTDAEDITQEAFLRLWKNPAQVREGGALRGWLIRVASNLVMDRFRKKPVLDLDEADEVPDTAPTAAHQLDKARISSRIDEAIARLPDRQRLALALVQYEQMTNIAAAKMMEISVDALESLLARARRTLKQQLSGEWKAMLATFADER